jgi:hypothetical protein
MKKLTQKIKARAERFEKTSELFRASIRLPELEIKPSESNKAPNQPKVPEEVISEIKKIEVAEIIRAVRTTFDNELCEARYLAYVYSDDNKLIAFYRPGAGLDDTNLHRDWRLIFCAIKDYESANSGRNPTKEFAKKIRELIKAGLEYIIDNPDCTNIVEDTDKTEQEIRTELNKGYDDNPMLGVSLYTKKNTFRDYKELVRDQGESRWAEDLKGIIGDEGYTTIPECKVLT